jgi:SAM-dependent methyltransferase
MKKLKQQLLRALNRFVYRGNKRLCPICHFNARVFLSFGKPPRPDAQCPSCGALERHRLFWAYMLKVSGLIANPPGRALHIAPEVILEQKLRSLVGKGYITADLMQADVDVRMDITDIKYPDYSFDFIYCSHVLEHVPDDIKAMREFRRVLTMSGSAILLVPITAEQTVEDPSIEDPKERLRLFGQEDHVRKYGPDYLFRLENAGFNVEVLEPEGFLDAREIERMGITPAAGVMYVCRK